MSYKDALQLLFPLSDLGGTFDQDITIEGKYLDDLGADADGLLLELFPDTCTAAMVADWERIYGVTPQVGDSLATRRNRVLTKIRQATGIRRDAMEQLAASLGYVITITENDCAPLSVCGITRCGQRLCSTGWLFQWVVNVAGPGPYADLEALLADLAPAYTQVLFNYT